MEPRSPGFVRRFYAIDKWGCLTYAAVFDKLGIQSWVSLVSESNDESNPFPLEAVATAYHEAGHAVVALALGRPIHRVTVVPSQLVHGLSTLGQCQIQKGRFRPTKDWLEDESLILLAGMVAEGRILGNYHLGGAASDLRAVRRFASQRANGEKQIERLERRWLDKCEHLLTDVATWQAVEWIAGELLKHQTISGRAARHFYELALKSQASS